MPPKLGGHRGLNKRRHLKCNKIKKGLINACSDPQPPNLGGTKDNDKRIITLG